ncbi:MAG: hypothetical protein B7Y86_09015 [Brevundimonas subvibrioides]|jgi:hypothetical protein|uniref:DUF2842 domain-containing protein n=1 Tax=Brevundimonas subvibrioides TaxID=74313 RepID=A0A258HJX2_9CAUL|nr:DUF2842 domain-containing protein [Brevundimonas subvibrioides]OYX56884.1 MAG: hypothetical protein B7Y86_09015 [Brevundimonas subvibrioides]
MGLRARRAIASVGIVAFLVLYVWGVIAIGAHVPDHPVATLLFYGLAGTLWGVPLLPLMSWAEGKPFLKKR